MRFGRSLSVVLGTLTLICVCWYSLSDRADRPSDSSKVARVSDAEGGAARSGPDDVEFAASGRAQSPSKREVLEFPKHWGASERGRMFSMPSVQLLELLDDDEVLATEGARDLLSDIYGACGLMVALADSPAPGQHLARTLPRAVATESAPNGSWCRSMIDGSRGTPAWDKLKKLMDLAEYAEPSRLSPSERAEHRAAEAALRADGSLATLMLDDDAMHVSAALDAMRALDDRTVVGDWRALDALSQPQQGMVWGALWRGLDCRFMGDCSAHSFPTAALCNTPGFQCDAGADYYSIMRRSLSPAQFDALMMLLNSVDNYRRQHSG